MITCFGEVLMDCLPDKNVIGGAPFNVAINLKRLGNDTQFVSQTGKDQYGNSIYGLAQKEGIQEYLSESNEYPTGYVSVKFIDNEPQYTIHKNTAWHFVPYQPLKIKPQYFVFGSLATFSPANKEVFFKYKQLLSDTYFICDLNLRSPFYSDEHILFCLEHCRLLKVNQDEWNQIKLLKSCTEDMELFNLLIDEYHIEQVLLTKGDQGAVLINEKDYLQVPVSPIPDGKFQDAIGAGDGFLAAFLDCYIKTKDGQLALKKASAYASKICQNQGAILLYS